MKLMTINKWLNPDTIVESFMLYCYSKLSDEQIEDNLVEFREDMRSGLYKNPRSYAKKQKNQRITKKLRLDLERA